jgi:hypothetical protein
MIRSNQKYFWFELAEIKEGKAKIISVKPIGIQA